MRERISFQELFRRHDLKWYIQVGHDSYKITVYNLRYDGNFSVHDRQLEAWGRNRDKAIGFACESLSEGPFAVLDDVNIVATYKDTEVYDEYEGMTNHYKTFINKKGRIVVYEDRGP